MQEGRVMQPSQMGTRAGLAPTQRLLANGPSEEWQSLTQDAQGWWKKTSAETADEQMMGGGSEL